MAQELILQGGPAQRCFQGRDARVGVLVDALGLVRLPPGVLAALFILLPPAAQQRLAKTVLPAELSKSFLAADELADDLQLELPAERAFGHRSAPQSGLDLLPALFSVGQGHARLLHVCLSLGVHHSHLQSTAVGDDATLGRGIPARASECVSPWASPIYEPVFHFAYQLGKEQRCVKGNV